MENQCNRVAHDGGGNGWHFARSRVGGNSEPHEKKKRLQIQKRWEKIWHKGGWKPAGFAKPCMRRREGAGLRGADILRASAHSPRRLSSICWVINVCIDLGIRVRRQVRCDLQESGLDQKIPHATRLVDIYLDQVSGFASTKLATPPGVLPYESLLNYEIRFRQDPQGRA